MALTIRLHLEIQKRKVINCCDFFIYSENLKDIKRLFLSTVDKKLLDLFCLIINLSIYLCVVNLFETNETLLEINTLNEKKLIFYILSHICLNSFQVFNNLK